VQYNDDGSFGAENGLIYEKFYPSRLIQRGHPDFGGILVQDGVATPVGSPLGMQFRYSAGLKTGSITSNNDNPVPGNVVIQARIAGINSVTVPYSDYFTQMHFIVGISYSTYQPMLDLVGGNIGGMMGAITFSNSNISATDKRVAQIVVDYTDNVDFDSASMSFYTANAGVMEERVRIDQQGNVTVGSSTTTAVSQTFSLVGVAASISLFVSGNTGQINCVVPNGLGITCGSGIFITGAGSTIGIGGNIDVSTGAFFVSAFLQVRGVGNVPRLTVDITNRLVSFGSPGEGVNVDMYDLPTSDPGVAGRVWRDDDRLMISDGPI
jgi:hypothetical protein